MNSAIAVAIFMVGCLLQSVIGFLNGTQLSAQLKLYDGVYYDNPFALITFEVANRCYQLDCGNLDNRVASARWSGLPTQGWLRKNVLISFYADADCKGAQESVVLPHNGGIREFYLKKVIGKISAFMVRLDGLHATYGYENVCNSYFDKNATLRLRTSN
ncbi:hypothetical protein F443_12807 [Phytophthora nicotianae P1569]|uniref:Uncharacterized protein n=1 Tax=Phytophthora nicotianae P1569 TaxID=1317065 RepID=V9ERW8_PHYNI|nr:hypothetical protein F443_12807 [Phytophthora nicotianae P1569]